MCRSARRSSSGSATTATARRPRRGSRRPPRRTRRAGWSVRRRSCSPSTTLSSRRAVSIRWACWPAGGGPSDRMLTGIRQAILPVALRPLHAKDDLDRTCLLIETLARHWRDRHPLELLVVVPTRDADVIRDRLPRLAGVNVTLRPESDFFARSSRFFMLTGWFRQQIVKLHVPAQLGFGGYLTLDSDVVCVGDFDSTTFVREGRALSRWEPKRHHDWWRSAAR